MIPTANGVVDVSAMLELILSTGADALRCSAGAVFVEDARGTQAALALHRIPSEEVPSLTALIAWALQGRSGRRPVRVRGTAVEAEPFGRWRGSHFVAELVPTDGGPFASLAFLRPPIDRPFLPGDLRSLPLLARQVGGVLAQARPGSGGQAERARLEDLQNTFVSIVSHELQTPVAIIKGYAGTLGRPDATWSPALVQRVAATIEAECDRLTRLITDLLDLARIQAGRVAMAFHPVDLAELLGEVVHEARGRAPNCQIELADLRELPSIRGDHDKLRMALNNLLDNAIKYSPRGSTITVGGRVREADVLLWVRDQGIGIAAEERERIFERFHRVDSSLTREQPGVGMGLYICRVIVEAHNGRVWVESEGLGRGSTFFISLPLVKP